MASRKTEVERIIDTALTAAGLPETETARLLEEHWEACCNRVDRARQVSIRLIPRFGRPSIDCSRCVSIRRPTLPGTDSV
jgi:hypothetical protein